MHHSRRSPITSQASVLGLLVLVAALLSLAMPGRAQAGTFAPLTGSATSLIAGPLVVTAAASLVTQTTATLNASVNPNGGGVIECKLEYGTTTAYGSSAPCASLPGSGNSPVPVSAALTGLAANTTYHFRISATNAGGTSKGEDGTLATLPNAPTVLTGTASPPTQTTTTLNATVNPNGGNVTECKFEYGTTTGYGSTASCAALPGSGISPVAVSAAITGLTANTTYHFRILATNAGGPSKGADETFTTLPNAPMVVTKAASAITLSTATLNATVNPNGGNVTECKFEYGTTTGYGSSASCAALPGSGISPVAVSAAITGLTANTTYHFRISATNAGGTNKGSDGEFKTTPLAPTAETGVASSVTQTTATLNAKVNPHGTEVTECELEYGTTASYGSEAACSPPPGSGSSAVEVSAAITGLSASTTYHFRVSARTLGGMSRGNDATFTTAAVPPVLNVGPTNPPATQAALPRPVLGRTANVATVAGQVRIRLPGTPGFVALSGARQIPYGTVVEATHGEVGVAAATPAGGIWIGRFFDGKFVLTQGGDGNVLATLAGGNFSVCSPRRRAGHVTRRVARGHLVRRLWAETGGNFSTKARYAEGIVHGAQWLTEDLCEGTLILATREHVEVTDLVHGRRAVVAAGRVDIVKPH
jgi:phosphodiesterase/alkaline phosphatase D-like protein